MLPTQSSQTGNVEAPSARVPTEDWLQTCAAALVEVATTMGLHGSVTGVGEGHPSGVAGSYVSLVSRANAVQIGLVASVDGCRSIAAQLLGLEEETEDLADPDMADGVGELVNVLVGVMKTHLQNQDSELALGLPVFLVGEVRSGSSTTSSRVDGQIGGVPCSVLLVMHKTRCWIPAKAS